MANRLIFGITLLFIFNLYAIGDVSARYCPSYCSATNKLQSGFYCHGETSNCCGTLDDRDCCDNSTHNLNYIKNDAYYCTSTWWIEHWRVMFGGFTVVVILLLCGACCCQCCAGNHSRSQYRRRLRLPGPLGGTNRRIHDENELPADRSAPERTPSMIFNPLSPTAFIPPEYAKDPPKYNELFGADGTVNPGFVTDVGESSHVITDRHLASTASTVPLPTDPVPSYEESARAAEASQTANAYSNQAIVTATGNANLSGHSDAPETIESSADVGIVVTVSPSGSTSESNPIPVTIHVQGATSSDTNQSEELQSASQTAPSSGTRQNEEADLPPTAPSRNIQHQSTGSHHAQTDQNINSSRGTETGLAAQQQPNGDETEVIINQQQRS